MRTRYDGLHRHFDHQSDECGWHTVSGDVRHQEAHPLPIDGNEFIEISSDGGHRLIGNRDPDVPDLGNAGGEDRELQPAGNRKFIFNRHQTALVGKETAKTSVPTARTRRFPSAHVRYWSNGVSK